jgi:RNA polymerase sigma-70 factor (ECF subfamily)
MPADPEVVGLLALMLLVESRRDARISLNGDLTLLADQDRGRWDAPVPRVQSAVISCRKP